MRIHVHVYSQLTTHTLVHVLRIVLKYQENTAAIVQLLPTLYVNPTALAGVHSLFHYLEDLESATL